MALVGVYVDLMALGPNLHDPSSIFPCAVLKLVTIIKLLYLALENSLTQATSDSRCFMMKKSAHIFEQHTNTILLICYESMPYIFNL